MSSSDFETFGPKGKDLVKFLETYRVVKLDNLRIPTRQEADFLLMYWGMKAIGKVS